MISMSLTSSAKTQRKVVFEQTEITDLENLIERADCGVTDDSDLSIDANEVNSLSPKVKDYEIKIKNKKVTSQKVKTEELADGTLVDSYSGFGYVDITYVPKNLKGAMSLNLIPNILYCHFI